MQFFPHLVAACALAAAATAPAKAAEPGHDVIGKWKLAAVLDSAEMTSIDETQARKLLGHVMTIGKDGVKFEGETCGAPDFETRRVDPDLYLREEAHIGAARLALPNPVTLVDLSCTVAFLKKPDRLVLHWEGFFFDAIRVRK
jgi:hypothetical protein